MIVLAPERVLAPSAPVDLHLHTLASDGAWTPEALFDHLKNVGFQVVAVCDHDTQASVLEARRLGMERGISVIAGVEMTTNWNDRQWHLLVYGIEPDRADASSQAFRDCLTEIAELLRSRADDARARIEAAGKSLPSLDEVRAGRSLTPYHVLMTAIKEGHAKALKDAAEMVVELGGTFTADLPLARVVAAAHEAGGHCSMAHPGRGDTVGVMTAEDLDRMMAEGIAIDALEAHYRTYTDAQTREYREMAESRGLLITCGSDSHAAKQPVDPRPWQAIWCAGFLALFGFAVERPFEQRAIWEEGMDPEVALPPSPTPTDENTDADNPTEERTTR